MQWERYKKKFVEEASSRNLQEDEIKSLLDYAFKLSKKNLPIIFDSIHFSKLVGYDLSYIERAIKYTPYFYRRYKIPKKNGKLRSISEPLPSLMEIQKWILSEILYKCKVSKYAKAYVKRRSLKANAVFHKKKSVVLTIDITDFFGSINQQKVCELFISMDYNYEVSTMLSMICTLNNKLPQGAPSSPCISNLITKEMDNEISKFCIERKINFTRYSDDLTFSGDKGLGGIIPYIERILNNYNFEINKDKLRTRSKHQSQEVTGIIVNEKLQAPKNIRRNFRQAVHYIKLFGIEDHLNHIKNNRKNYLCYLMGTGNFICFVNPNDYKAKQDLEYLKMEYKRINNSLS